MGGPRADVGDGVTDSSAPRPRRSGIRRAALLSRENEGRRVIVGIALLCLPLLYFVVTVLAHGWVPQGDEALVAVRIHDVWSAHPPLVGMRSTSNVSSPGVYAHHPGPMEFYLLAVPYAVTGFAGWSIIVGDAIVACSFVAIAVWHAYRAVGLNGAWIAGALVLLTERSFGHVLVQPLNTWPAVLALVAALVLAWRLVLGQYKAMPWYVGCATYAAQAQVIDFSVVAVLSAFLAMLGLLRWWDRRGAVWPIPGPGQDRSRALWWRRPGWISVGLLVVLWFPPMVDVVVDHPNNLSELISTFSGAHSGPMVGVWTSMQDVAALVVPVGGHLRHTGASTPGAAGAVAALLVVAVLFHAIWTGRGVFRQGSGRDGAVASAAAVGLVLTGALVWTGSHAVYPLQLLYLDLVQPAALFASMIAIWAVCRRVVRLLVRTRRLPAWRGTAGAVVAVVAVAVAVTIALLPAVHNVTRQSQDDQRLAGRVVAAAGNLLGAHGGLRRPIVVQGYGLTSYSSLSPAVCAALVAGGEKVYFDSVWPLPQDDDFRRSRNAPRSSWRLVLRERTGTGPWSLPVVPGRTVATTTVVPHPGGSQVTVQLLLIA